MKNCRAIVLARLDSKRFPGKALYKINGKSLIDYCITPLVSSSIFNVILATSDRAVDDPLNTRAIELGIPCFRGSLENVAKRVKECIELHDIDYFARINGDSPFVRRELLEEAFRSIATEDLDFVTNLVPRTFPYGISVEVFKSATFLQYADLITSEKYCEHFTSFFYDNIKLFRFRNISLLEDYSNIRLTVDEVKDVPVVEFVYSNKPNIADLPFDEIISEYKKYIAKS
jgi:spore coat polysaccharide biosynthesis protein SpsF